jgi:hypothetical protein
MPIAVTEILAMALKFGVPAGIQGYHFIRELLDAGEQGMTQEEFQVKWDATRARYVAAGHVWDEAGQSPDAKA